MPKHTDMETEAAAARFEQWADGVDPATIRWQEAPELAAVAQVAESVRAGGRPPPFVDKPST